MWKTQLSLRNGEVSEILKNIREISSILPAIYKGFVNWMSDSFKNLREM